MDQGLLCLSMLRYPCSEAPFSIPGKRGHSGPHRWQLRLLQNTAWWGNASREILSGVFVCGVMGKLLFQS